MSFFGTILVFLIFRLTDLLVSYFSPYFIPYLGFFPYKEIAVQYNLPKLLTAFANFDGVHYLLIAKNWYTTYQQAFFPLYPLLIRWVAPIFSNNLLLTGLIISNLSFLLGLFIFLKYLKLTFANKQLTIWSVVFLLSFPTSFFFSAVYTEGLFFLFFLASLYFLKKERFILAGIFAFLASLVKLIGFFLIIFFLLKLIKNYKFKIRNFRLVVATLLPGLGLGIYGLYLWRTMGDPLFFLHSQWAFGANRSSNLIFLPQVYYRYLNIFFKADLNFQYFISLFEFFTFNFVFIILILDLINNLKPASPAGRLKNKNINNLGLNLFSLINLLLPTFTGTFSSLPRYALFSLSFFIYLANIKSFLIRLVILISFILLHIITLSFFIQGYFVS